MNKYDRLRQTKHRDGVILSKESDNAGNTTRRFTEVERINDNFVREFDPVVKSSFRLIALNDPPYKIPEEPKRKNPPVEPGELSCLFSFCGWTNFTINGITPTLDDGVIPEYDVTPYDSGFNGDVGSYVTEMRRFGAPIYSTLPIALGNTWFTNKTYKPTGDGKTLTIKAEIATLPDNFYTSSASVLKYQFYDQFYVQHPLGGNAGTYDYRPLVGNAKNLSDMLTYNFDVWIRVPEGVTSVNITGGLKGHTIGTFSANYRITEIVPEGIEATDEFLINNALYGYLRPTTEYIPSPNAGEVRNALELKGITNPESYNSRIFADIDTSTGQLTNAKNVRNDLCFMQPFEYNFAHPEVETTDISGTPNYQLKLVNRLPVLNGQEDYFMHTAISQIPYYPQYLYPDHRDFWPNQPRPVNYKDLPSWSFSLSKPVSNVFNSGLFTVDIKKQVTSVLKSGVYGYSTIHYGGVYQDGTYGLTYGRWFHKNNPNNNLKQYQDAIEMQPDTTGWIPHREFILDRYSSVDLSTNQLKPSDTALTVIPGSLLRVRFWASINHLMVRELPDLTIDRILDNSASFDNYGFYDSFNAYLTVSLPLYNYSKPALDRMPARPTLQNFSWMTGSIYQDWSVDDGGFGVNYTNAFRQRDKYFDCYLAPLELKQPVSFEVNLQFA